MKRVLVVDDDNMLLRAITRALSLHFVVSGTTSARLALEMAAHDPFDAVISDISMPSMNGFEFRDALLKIVPSLDGKILFVSGGGSTMALDKMLDNIEYLKKPFRNSDLVAAVRKITDGGDSDLPGLRKSDGTEA